MSKKSKAAAAASSSASADTTQTAKDAEGIEVKIEVGAEVEDILEEMCGSFSGESRDAKLVRGYVDRIRERIGAASEKAAQNIDTMIKMKGGLANAVFEAVREAEERGIRWDETNTEPVNKVFRVEFQLGPYDRIKLGLLAKRAHVVRAVPSRSAVLAFRRSVQQPLWQVPRSAERRRPDSMRIRIAADHHPNRNARWRRRRALRIQTCVNGIADATFCASRSRPAIREAGLLLSCGGGEAWTMIFKKAEAGVRIQFFHPLFHPFQIVKGWKTGWKR